jgi:hypothetical protein
MTVDVGAAVWGGAAVGAEHATAAAASIPRIAAAARTAGQLPGCCLVMAYIYRAGPTSRVPALLRRTFSPAVLLS